MPEWYDVIKISAEIVETLLTEWVCKQECFYNTSNTVIKIWEENLICIRNFLGTETCSKPIEYIIPYVRSLSLV